MGKVACIGCTCLLVLTFLMRFFYMRDPYYIHTLLLAVCLAYYWIRKPLKLTNIDICLLLWWMYFGLLPSVNAIGMISAFFGFTGSILFYFLVRYTLAYSKNGISYLLSALTVCISIVSILALSFFVLFSNRVHETGFVSLYDFRTLYKPLGVPLNEWNALQWLFGGILVSAYRECKDKRVKVLAVLTGGMVLCLSLLSFSRGMYLAGAVFLLFLVVVERKRLFGKRSLLIGGFYGLLIVEMCVLYPAETFRVIQGNETLSQQRSAESRIKEVDIAKAVLSEYPFGVGFGNYTMAKDFFQHGEERVDTYTSYAMNTFSKVAVEGGYAGLFFYFLLLLSIVVYLVRKKERDAWLLFLFLIAFFIREQTFSTLFDSYLVQLSALAVLALLQKDEKASFEWKHGKWLAALPCLVWIGLFVTIRFIDGNEQSVPKLVNRALACRQTDRQMAVNLFRQAQLQSPLDVQLHFYEYEWCGQDDFSKEDEEKVKKWAVDYPDRLLFRWTLYEWYKQCGRENEAEEILVDAILREPRILETSFWKMLQEKEFDFADSVKTELKEKIQNKPDDVIRLAKYGSVALQLEQTGLAEDYLREANRLLPNLSRVWFNLALLLEKQGKWEEADLYRKKGRLIELGVLSKDEAYIPVPVKNIKHFLYKTYPLLFGVWYRSELLTIK